MKSVIMAFLAFNLLSPSAKAELTEAQQKRVTVCTEKYWGLAKNCATLAELRDAKKRQTLFTSPDGVEEQRTRSLEALLNYLNSPTFEVQYRRLELKSGTESFGISFTAGKDVSMKGRVATMELAVHANGLGDIQKMKSVNKDYPLVGFNELVNDTFSSLERARTTPITVKPRNVHAEQGVQE